MIQRIKKWAEAHEPGLLTFRATVAVDNPCEIRLFQEVSLLVFLPPTLSVIEADRSFALHCSTPTWTPTGYTRPTRSCKRWSTAWRTIWRRTWSSSSRKSLLSERPKPRSLFITNSSPRHALTIRSTLALGTLYLSTLLTTFLCALGHSRQSSRRPVTTVFLAKQSIARPDPLPTSMADYSDGRPRWTWTWMSGTLRHLSSHIRTHRLPSDRSKVSFSESHLFPIILLDNVSGFHRRLSHDPLGWDGELDGSTTSPSDIVGTGFSLISHPHSPFTSVTNLGTSLANRRRSLLYFYQLRRPSLISIAISVYFSSFFGIYLGF